MAANFIYNKDIQAAAGFIQDNRSLEKRGFYWIQ